MVDLIGFVIRSGRPSKSEKNLLSTQPATETYIQAVVNRRRTLQRGATSYFPTALAIVAPWPLFPGIRPVPLLD